MNFSKKTRIAFVNGKPPVRKRMDEDGVVVKEKLPGIPMQRKWLLASGTIAQVTHADGKSVGSFDNDGRLEVTDPDNVGQLGKWKRMVRDGALLFAECPYANGMLRGKEPCKGHDGNGRFWTWANRRRGMLNEEESCEHIKAIAKARQEAHAAKQAELAEQFKSEDAKALHSLLALEHKKLEAQNKANAVKLNKKREASR